MLIKVFHLRHDNEAVQCNIGFMDKYLQDEAEKLIDKMLASGQHNCSAKFGPFYILIKNKKTGVPYKEVMEKTVES